MFLTRRSLVAALGLALPVASVASTASANTATPRPHGKKHGGTAHIQHHAKPHRTAAAKPVHTKQA
jgi:hypothetical protein